MTSSSLDFVSRRSFVTSVMPSLLRPEFWESYLLAGLLLLGARALTPPQPRRILSRSCPEARAFHGPLYHSKRVLGASCALPHAG
jgi:hypothetical protein